MSRSRVVIENITPCVDGGRFPAKRITGDPVRVEADVFADGHDLIASRLRFRKKGEGGWREVPMRPLGNDRWQAVFTPDSTGLWEYTVRAWIDRLETLRMDIGKKHAAGQDVGVELLSVVPYLERMLEAASVKTGLDAGLIETWIPLFSGGRETATEAIEILRGAAFGSLVRRIPLDDFATEYAPGLSLRVDRERAGFAAWYELFPRSARGPGPDAPCGTFAAVEALLPDIRELGFDVLYLPPVHPIGRTSRKGRNNALEVEEGDPGSPWAVGSAAGGHTSADPGLGTMEDFEHLVAAAEREGLEPALDIAFQCSPDHPWVTEHPEWFRRRPDGTVQYAENPPKKYEDILPLNFETDDWKNLWEALRDVFLFWIGKGVSTFRVDNPHTKPFPFWEWVIGEIQRDHPDTVFLSEAFTRPKVMYRLAKLGFTQSYTYFTWRNTKRELESYIYELTLGDPSEFFRPSFWPNTPDILPEYLQYGGRPAFMARFVLAATLSPLYGIYGPAYELCVSAGIPGKEEYLDSEKFEIRIWDREAPGNIRPLVKRVNEIRREHPALRSFRNVRFLGTGEESVLVYERFSDDRSDVLLVAVNLDPFQPHGAHITLDPSFSWLDPDRPVLVERLLSGGWEQWSGEAVDLELDSTDRSVEIFRVLRYVRQENDFDYYM